MSSAPDTQQRVDVGPAPALTGAVPVHRILARPPAGAGRKYVAELIGTFVLVFTVGSTIFATGTLDPLAVGAVIMVLIYAIGHISGGHINPAVTLGVLVRGRIGLRDAVGYWVVQLVGGVLAALLARWLFAPVHVTVKALSGHAMGAAFVAELLFTFALVFVMLNVATSKDHPGNSFYGLAIGFTVLAGAVAVGGISGGVFNPAVFLGGAVMGAFAWSTIWVYLVAEVLAGVLAGLAFRALNPADR
jgi:aquaporin Z